MRRHILLILVIGGCADSVPIEPPPRDRSVNDTSITFDSAVFDATPVSDMALAPDAAPPPDDPCIGHNDGSYCGSELGAGADHGAAYTCADGQVASVNPCGLGCASGQCSEAPEEPCANRPDSAYCGGSLGEDDGRLYFCQRGMTIGSEPCPMGCRINPPGTPDSCRHADDPCGEQPDGAWCGAHIDGGIDSLYICHNGQTAEAQLCPNGCEERPAGNNDRCRAGNDPCASADAGNGAYCGRTLGAGQPDTLYRCHNQATLGAENCIGACEAMPAGVDDRCQAGDDPCAAAHVGNGAYCGRTLGTGEPDTLYDCQNQVTAGRQACPTGCQEMPPGTPDACRAVDDPCQPAPVDGLYCGRTLGTGDADTLYTCRDNGVAAATPCANGCQENPPGVPDQCLRGPGECCLDHPPGILTQQYSACGGGGEHYGVDYGTATGTPIHAGMSGTVVASRLGLPNCYNNGCTPACWSAFNYVKVRTDCGDPNAEGHTLYLWYLHIDGLAPGVADGSHVEQGQLLAFSGNSGCSSGPHIHIETVSLPQGQDTHLSTCASANPASRYCP